jgi:hypothetical protein
MVYSAKSRFIASKLKVKATQSLHCFKMMVLEATKSFHCLEVKGFKATQSLYRCKFLFW